MREKDESEGWRGGGQGIVKEEVGRRKMKNKREGGLGGDEI